MILAFHHHHDIMSIVDSIALALAIALAIGMALTLDESPIHLFCTAQMMPS